MSTPGIDWLRKQYPMYSDLPDSDLVSGFKTKFYPDLSDEEFSAALDAKGIAAEPVLKKVGRIAAAIPGAIAEGITRTPKFLVESGALAAPFSPGAGVKQAAEYIAKHGEEAYKLHAADAALDIGLLAVGGPASKALKEGFGLTNTIARLTLEGAGIGATYSGVEGAVAGESAQGIAKDIGTGALYGGAGGLTLGIGGKAVGAVIRRLVGHAEMEAAVAARAVEQAPPPDAPPINRGNLLAEGRPEPKLLTAHATGAEPGTPPYNVLPSGGRVFELPERMPVTERGTPPINVLPSSGEIQYGTPVPVHERRLMLPRRSSIAPTNVLKSSGKVFTGTPSEAFVERQTLDPNIGGGTWYYGQLIRPMDKPGYVVALTGKGMPVGVFNQRQIAHIREQSYPLFQAHSPNFTFTTGTWIDDKTGKVWVETGIVLPNKEEALQLALKAKQKSIAELGPGGQFIGVHETGLTKAGTLTVQEARDLLDKFVASRKWEPPLAGPQ